MVAALLSFGVAGCRKGPQRVTNIHGLKPGEIPEQPSKPIEPGTTKPITVDTAPPAVTLPDETKSGIPLSGADRSNWPADTEIFAAQTVYFDFDKSVVKASEMSKVEDVANRMKSMPGKALRIEGHCDERGTEEYNRALGERRARAVREALVRLGVAADLIDTISYGEDRPADPGHDDAAWAKNRRGVFVLLSPPGGGN